MSKVVTVMVSAVVVQLFACAVSAQDAVVEGWPREIDTARGLVVLYQPQLDELEGPKMTARMAVSITPSGQSSPVFGAVWLDARIETDVDARTVEILEVEVPRARFPDATDEQQEEFAALLAREIPSWNMTLSLDRLSAMLEIVESRRMIAEGLDDTAPTIRFVNYAAILVSIDGDPQLREVEGSTTLKRSVW